jgi:predicted PurR-regulated permease PerM
MNRDLNYPLIDTILRIVVLFFLIVWCIWIILPFIEPVIWGAIIAVAIYHYSALFCRQDLKIYVWSLLSQGY